MNREETIERLCRLVSRVGEEVYKNEHPHDCFCRENRNPMISNEILTFIEDAVSDSQRRAAAAAVNRIILKAEA